MGEEGKKLTSLKFSKESEIAATRELYYSLLSAKGYRFQQNDAPVPYLNPIQL
jgi:hypothetical protein